MVKINQTKDGGIIMKVELKPIIDQLSEALRLSENKKVAAIIDETNNNEIIGWTIVEVNEDGTILKSSLIKGKMLFCTFGTLKELFNYLLWN